MKEVVYIWLDDERQVPKVKKKFGYHVAKIFRVTDYNECIETLEKYRGVLDEIWLDLDHDLGLGKTGYDVTKYIVKNGIEVRYNVHSMNPVGKKNIEQLFSRYGYKTF